MASGMSDDALLPSGSPSAGEDDKPILLPGKTSTRILAELADIFLTLILGIVLYSVAFLPAFGYDALNQEMLTTSKAMLQEETASYLVSQNTNGVTYSEDDLQYFWIKNYAQGNSVDQQGVSSDFLFDYYTLYRKSGLYSTREYNEKILGLPSSASGTNTSLYFAFDTSASDPQNSLGVLSAEAKATLLPYYGSEQTAESVALYQKLKAFFSSAYSAARNEFVSSEPFYSLLLSYASVFHARVNAFVGASFVSYLVSAVIFFLLIPFIGLKGMTVGKKILKLEVKNPDGSRLRVWQLLSRGAVEILEYSFLIAFMGVLNLGFDTFSLPLFSWGNWQVTMTALFIAGVLVSLASMLFLIFRKNHQSFHDFASMSFVYTSDYALIDVERHRLEKLREQSDERNLEE